MPVKQVAVIGAGAAGLTAIKCCLEEGLQPTCYEQSAHIGGLWHFTEQAKKQDSVQQVSKDQQDSCQPKDQQASKGKSVEQQASKSQSKDNQDSKDHDLHTDHQATVFRSTTSNVSKMFLCYSDFPQPQERPYLLPHYLVCEYLERYAAHFRLSEHVQLEHEVLSVKYLQKNHGEDGLGVWEVSVRDLQTGEVSVNVFDAVMVCAGLFRNPVIPDFPGLSSFKGEVIHTHAYRDAEPFQGKKVLVVGFSECVVDAAIEISRVNKKVNICSPSHLLSTLCLYLPRLFSWKP